MSYYTTTTTRTQTVTHTDVKNVIWKIKSDLYQIRLFHKKFDELYESQLVNDLFNWVYSNYCSEFKFTFFTSVDQQCVFELRYKITIGIGTITTNDEAGMIPYLPLADKAFKVIITTNLLWEALTEQQKQAFYARMSLAWGPSYLNLSYAHGNWTGDKTYSSNQISASRSVFIGL